MRLFIDETRTLGHLNPEIQGHFSEHLGRCIYEGVFVGEDSPIPNVNGMRCDVVNALKELRVPVLRWPGGCFADEYHWQDGIGPRETRKRMINTHWGGVLEDNSFGTHEYFELCRQIGCKTYINGNVGSGSVREMSEWIEYMTFGGVSPMADLRRKNGHEEPWKVDYFGVGNENWGCGGNMTPAYYANLYRRFQTYIRQYNADAPIAKICCGPNVDDTVWTRDVLKTCTYNADKRAHGYMDALSLHHYTFPDGWDNKVSATVYNETDWYKTLQKALYMEELIRMHSAIMDEYDPEKKIALVPDEWGTWFDVEPGTNPGFLYQQSTLRDALVAAVTIDIFNRHCDRVKMANIAQMINVLQSVILTDGAHMLRTPTYHALHMMRAHQDAELLDSRFEDLPSIGAEGFTVPHLSCTASVKDGQTTLTIANLSYSNAAEVTAEMKALLPKTIDASILTGAPGTFNTFEAPDTLCEKPFNGVTRKENTLSFSIPACSIVRISFR